MARVAFGCGQQRHIGAAFAKTGHTTLAVKLQGVAVGGLHIQQLDAAFETRAHGPTFSATTAASPSSPTRSKDSQPLMQRLSTSGSFSAAQVCATVQG